MKIKTSILINTFLLFYFPFKSALAFEKTLALQIPINGYVDNTGFQFLDYQSAFVPGDQKNCSLVFFERAGSMDSFTELKSQIFYKAAPSFNEIHEQPAQNLFFGIFDKYFVANPRWIQLHKKNYLYFNAYNRETNEGFIYRLQFSSVKTSSGCYVQWGKLQSVVFPENLKYWYRSWVQPFSLKNGNILLMYEYFDQNLNNNILNWTTSSDGLIFEQTHSVAVGAQLVRFLETQEGYWIVTFQREENGNMVSYFLFSSNQGQSWSIPEPLSYQDNVHDAFPFQDFNKNIFIYYISTNGESYFSLYRAPLNISLNGLSVGELQRLTEGFDLHKPCVVKDAFGRSIVFFPVIYTPTDGSSRRSQISWLYF